MFSAVTIGILASLSCMAWVYSKTMRRTGNNNKSSLITSAVAGVITFGMVVTFVWTIDSLLNS